MYLLYIIRLANRSHQIGDGDGEPIGVFIQEDAIRRVKSGFTKPDDLLSFKSDAIIIYVGYAITNSELHGSVCTGHFEDRGFDLFKRLDHGRVFL